MNVDSLDYPLWDGSTLLSSSEGQEMKVQGADFLYLGHFAL